MTKQEKRLQKMRDNPKTVSYSDFVHVLEDFGYDIRMGKGSHRGAKLTIGERGWRLTFVQPHGKRKFMHPEAVKDLLIQITEIEDISSDE